MKRLFSFMVSIFILLLTGNAHGAFVSGSTGADGAFNPTANTELQLPPDGVFNFTTVNIPSGITVTFKKNAGNTPVYILATGDVTIAGTINVNGTSATSTSPGTGGPGGYDGGYGGATGLPGGKGLGPGGGGGGLSITYSWGGGGGFGTPGGKAGANYAEGGPSYGNATLIPLIGGSGGGGQAGSSASGYSGGGGGAILIASSTTITVTGTISANGGGSYFSPAGGGSGGAIKLIANTISGNGTITALGGSLGYSNKGGAGRIRLEAYINNRTAGTDPVYTYGNPGTVFVANTPTLSITSVAGVNVPANPTGSYAQPDMLLPSTTTNPVTVNLSASNIPITTTVKVSVIPQYGSASTVDATLSGTDSSSTGSASVNLSTSYSNVITAEATFTLQTAMFYDGEKIEKVRVAATMGRESEVVYITGTGKEIKGELLAGIMK